MHGGKHGIKHGVNTGTQVYLRILSVFSPFPPCLSCKHPIGGLHRLDEAAHPFFHLKATAAQLLSGEFSLIVCECFGGANA